MARRTTVGLIVATLSIATAPRKPLPPLAPQGAPSSYDLIDRALAAGQIDRETAYKYRVFAAFQDPRLPMPYRGDDSGIPEIPPSAMEALPLLSTFSPQTQADLKPFFMPPSQPGSWFELMLGRTGAPGDDADGGAEPEGGPRETNAGSPPAQWHVAVAAGGKAKVWGHPANPGDPALADAIARELTTRIWPRLTTLFWEPEPDGNATWNGSTPEVDFFLIRPSFTPANASGNIAAYGTSGAWNGMAMTSNPGEICQPGPYFLLINSGRPLGGVSSKGLLQTITHELTHAITMRYATKEICHKYAWFREATGVWSEHFVYPLAQSEHGWAPHYFTDPARSLDTPYPGPFERNGYASYVFPFYLQLMGKQAAMPKIWRAFATLDQRGGIDAGLKTVGSSLDKEFPKFAVRNRNADAVDDYLAKDGLNERFVIHDLGVADFSGGQSFYQKDITTGMKYLSTKYTRIDVHRTVGTLTFDNPLVDIPWAGVWAMEEIDGVWKAPVDWTRLRTKTYCRSIPAEKLNELVLVFTNNEWKDTTRIVDPTPSAPVIRAYPAGCGGWSGTTEMVNTITSRDPAITIVETVNATMQLALDSALVLSGQPKEYWKAVSGTINWRADVTGQCQGSGSGQLSITNRPAGDEMATLRVWVENGVYHHSGTGGGWPTGIPKYTIRCPTGPAELVFFGALGWWVTDFNKDDVAPDGKSFKGDFVKSTSAEIVTRHKYDFKCVSGC